MQDLRTYKPRRAGRLNAREQLALLAVFGLSLLPLKDFQVLQFLALLDFIALFFIVGRIRASLLLWVMSFLIFVVGLNLLAGHASLEVLKPLWGVFAMIAAFGMQRALSRAFYERFVTITFAMMMLFYVLHTANLTAFNNLFRVTSQDDAVHLSRVTAPFLFAGDFGLVSLFMAMLSFTLGTKRFTVIGIGFLVLLLFSQSRLALAGTPYILLMAGGGKRQLVLFVAASVAVATLLLNIDKFFEMFPYIFRFVDKFGFYVTESKRAMEVMYLYENFWSIFIGGTDKYVLPDGLDTAESSIVSYAVKSGVLATLVFWVSMYAYGIRYLAGGARLMTLLLLLSTFGAPLDRPKSSVFLIAAIAGVSSLLRKETDTPAMGVGASLHRISVACPS